MLNYFAFLILLASSLSSNVILSNKVNRNYYTFNSNRVPELGPQSIGWQSQKPSFNSFNSKSPVLFIHGFGGNCDQFRKNLPIIAKNGHAAYAIDLLGYGYSDKPNPKNFEVNKIYNFENWADLTCSFITDIIKEPCYVVCNSVGGVAGLQSAVQRPDLIKGIVLIDISLRMLHIKKQNPALKPFVKILQNTLRETNVGKTFFKQIATPKAIRNILNQAYGYTNTKQSIDDETLDFILTPGLQPGAVDVFLDFISYSGGPLPEELLPLVSCPVRFLWGENDPWEPIEMGRKEYANFSCVDEFVSLPGGGHCPMDQIPQVVNEELLRFLSKYETKRNFLKLF
eukprot:gene13760-18453_t